MLVTEGRARSKYCVQCFTKVVKDGFEFDTCRGSDCMAWRWASRPLSWKKVQYSNQPEENMPEPPRPEFLPRSWEWYNGWEDGEGCGWIESEEEYAARRLGYCGLVGRPTQDRDY